MVVPLVRAVPGTKVLLFGPQALGLDAESASQLRQTVLSTPGLSWVLETITELPGHWESLAEAVPSLQPFPGAELLQDLANWLKTGHFSQASFPLPNVLLTPLVVVTHLAQYLKFLELIQPDSPECRDLHASFQRDAETLGLCSGLLSAAALSCSTDQVQLQHYGAVAVRLAMMVGALVDAQDVSVDGQGGSKSFSVAWNSPESGVQMTEILKTFPEVSNLPNSACLNHLRLIETIWQAYVSVLFDKKRATITASKSIALSLQQRLKDAGVIVADVGLRGSFHSQSHRDDVELLMKYCESHPAFQFLDASELALPTRSNTGGGYISNDKLHHVVLRSMLTEQSNWHQAFNTMQSSVLTHDESLVICFGPERCLPSSLMRKLGPRFIQVADLDLLSTNLLGLDRPLKHKRDVSDTAVAVVGMSCKLPGADDLEEFWKLLCAGKSQHVEVPDHRFGFETTWRDLDAKRKWFGNFIQDHDTFDHKFFKKSPREMASTDPQHRLMLQAAYQAVEQSGYFASPDQDKHIGCYIGVGLVDYENNIACHAANAYSATGNLKAFVAGKISHYFGWTGPGLTIDTACSSSAVAIHTACRAILSGECTAALAGGVNVMSSPEWFQNLAGASFLSPTGQCKPFDAKGDGYCRGEGVGAVFLKKLSSAIADGDQVYGVIASTAVFQNQNCTAITVPNAASLSDLFGNATRQAGLDPKQITVVEAHGTGTPVGDPAEYDGIRKVFGGPERANTLSLGSVKGLVGHTESASGIVALLKTLLMVHERAIPPQASFQTINPSINASPSDKIEIATSLKSWDVDFRAALINNYGASGSNATLVVTQPPAFKSKTGHSASTQSSGTKYPFWFSGFDEQSLRTYAARFLRFLNTHSGSTEKFSTGNLAFQVSRQSNRSLGHALIFSCSSRSELEEKLIAFGDGLKSVQVTVRQPTRPVVLCFGGQISKFVGLDQHVYESVKILRDHLDQCNAVCQSIGLDGIYPEIFQRSPIEDIVKLQTALFAIQYSCAKSWIDCRIEVAAVVGHSFGELTALCVSGVLSLIDAIKMVAGRAQIIKKCWGDEKGSMMAVEADLVDVDKLLAESSKACPGEPSPTIACFNGPRSFTLAGTAKAIDVAAEIAASFTSVKSKKLNVTNAFHSTLVEPLMADLERLGQGLTLNEPIIPLERAIEFESAEKLTSRFFADHLRKPVYFNHAVQRLAKQYPACVWLEAGSNSTITTMASRALGSPSSSHFQPINITSDGGFQFLTEATTNLWKAGLDTSFWSHHPAQTSEYDPLLLPPYQFEKSKHWMELKKPQKAIALPAAPAPAEEMPKGLWTFVGYQDSQKRTVRFRVNTMIKKYSDYVSGHIIAQTAPLCPSTLQLDIAIDALMSLRPEFSDSSYQPQLQGMDSHAPMSMDPSRLSWLDAEALDADSLIWDWKITSQSEQGVSAPTLHVSGKIVFRHANDAQYQNDFARYERLVGRQRCLRLLEGNDVDEVIQGRNIYKTFAEIVEYAEVYRGVRKIVGKDNESAGRVIKAYKGDTWLDTGLADSFCQVAGIFVNSMTDRSDGEMYISDRIDQWIRSPSLLAATPRPEIWEIFACHHRPSDKECTSDVFIFDPRSGALLEVILGIHYLKVSKAGLSKVLARLTPSAKTAAAPSAPVKIEATNGGAPPPSPIKTSKPAKPAAKKEKPARIDISGPVRELLSNLSGLEIAEIKDDSDLVEIGIDSLMGMELAREVEIAFKCTLDTTQLMELTDFKSLIKCIQSALGGTENDAAADDDDEEDEEEEESAGDDQAEGKTPQMNGFTNGDGNHVNGISSHTNGSPRSPAENDTLPAKTILEAFGESKQATDRFITEYKLGNYVHQVLPKSTELCVVHILDAFEKLGCPLRTAKPGQKLERVKYLPKHEQFMEFIYDLLEKEARLIDIDGAHMTRTAVLTPTKSAEVLVQDLIRNFPDHAADQKLTYLTGSKLAECLTGEADGLQLIFGTAEGKEIASAMYGKSPINVAWIKQIEDFLTRLMSKLPTDGGPIKILEMGAGTGGTTARMVPLLASLGVPVQYTVTDLSSSLVAGARKRFKQYSSMMEYRVLDIEKPPTPELLHSQHMVLATNCVHATHSLVKSTKNIHDVLRPDGFLLMLEMTETLPWIDLIFGLLEGWWLFDDGRRHALAPPAVWEQTLQSVGYGHVDWTEGHLPEANVQRVIVALASSPRYDRAPELPKPPRSEVTDCAARQAAVDAYVQKYTQGFAAPTLPTNASKSTPTGHCVLLTGATGSLGSHLVAYFAEQPNVKTVVCLNRHSSTEPTLRQQQGLKSRGISLGPEALSKLKVFETDTSKPLLGLPSNEHEYLANTVTHIVHNAWPMSISRPIQAFEPQFKVMQQLIGLAREISQRSGSSSSSATQASKVSLQFISSIGTVGHHPLRTGHALVPEERMTVDSVLPNGYGDAKLVCERMLDETLHRYPDRMRGMAVRIGQIAGSKVSGYWNAVEHFAFMVKSAQTLRALPDLEGVCGFFFAFRFLILPW
jgi:acyl transferase domain-containing protein/nucleoside-diphosphate-sugar epimerase/SAM-dependent methyltransferase/acyl carrier protein